MDVYKIAVKIFAARDSIKPEQAVPVFHRWIQNQSVEGHLLIDVAEYAHVPAGPGTVLVSSEANFHVDCEGNRLGLTYWRKLPLQGSFSQRLRAAIGQALNAAAQLEKEPELAGLIFRGDEISIRLNDRLRTPATEETIAAAQPEVEATAKSLFGKVPVHVESKPSPLELLEFRIKADENLPLATLLERAGI